MITLKNKIVDFLLWRSMDLFMLGMRMQKRKYPLYWTGPNFKNFKYATWFGTLSNLLRLKMKTWNWTECSIVIDPRGMMTLASRKPMGLPASTLKIVCEKAALMWGRVAENERHA